MSVVLLSKCSGSASTSARVWCTTRLEVRRGQGTGVVGVNRHLGSLRSVFNWAVRVGYVEQSPFKRGTEAAIKLSKEHGRSRRLDGDEETKLLAACAPHLRAVAGAALETGMRRGEILSLQWSQVEGMKIEPAKRPAQPPTLTWAPKAEIVLPCGVHSGPMGDSSFRRHR